MEAATTVSIAPRSITARTRRSSASTARAACRSSRTSSPAAVPTSAASATTRSAPTIRPAAFASRSVAPSRRWPRPRSSSRPRSSRKTTTPRGCRGLSMSATCSRTTTPGTPTICAFRPAFPSSGARRSGRSSSAYPSPCASRMATIPNRSSSRSARSSDLNCPSHSTQTGRTGLAGGLLHPILPIQDQTRAIGALRRRQSGHTAPDLLALRPPIGSTGHRRAQG